MRRRQTAILLRRQRFSICYIVPGTLRRFRRSIRPTTWLQRWRSRNMNLAERHWDLSASETLVDVWRKRRYSDLIWRSSLLTHTQKNFRIISREWNPGKKYLRTQITFRSIFLQHRRRRKVSARRNLTSWSQPLTWSTPPAVRLSMRKRWSRR